MASPSGFSLRHAVLLGASGWLAFATVEMCAASLAPLVVSLFPRVHPGTTAVLFVTFLLVGSFLGAAGWLIGSAWIAPDRREPFVAGFIACTIALLVVSHVLMTIEGVMVAYVCGVLIAVSVAIAVMTFGSPEWGHRLRFLGSPWVVSLLLIGTLWMAREGLPEAALATKLMLAAGWLLVVVLSFHAGEKLIRRMSNARVTEGGLRLAISCLCSLLLFGVALGVDARQPEQDPLPAAREPEAQMPNVLLVTLDTVRADHLSLYGYDRDTTPFLRSFGSRAHVFTRAIASSNHTLATHASIFTGQHASSHGAQVDYDDELGWQIFSLPSSAVTLAELLRRNGHATGAVVANYGFLGKEFGLSQGFGFLDARAPLPFLGVPPEFLPRHLVTRILRRFIRAPDAYIITRRADVISREAAAIIKELGSKSEPFFLFVNYMDAHVPYLPPPPFDDMFPGRDYSVHTSHLLAAIEKRRSRDPHALFLHAGEREHLVSQYDGAIRYIDEQLRHLIAALHEAGVLDETLIIIASDHGEAFGERSHFGHGTSAYQDQIAVPLVVRLPGQRSGSVVDTAVSTVDILPTILEVLGIAPPRGLDGFSLLVSRPDSVIAESFPLEGGVDPSMVFWNGRAVVREGRKLLVSGSDEIELYDLDEDPMELHDRSSESAELIGEMRQQLPPITHRDRFVGRPDAETVRKLRALGYIQ